MAAWWTNLTKYHLDPNPPKRWEQRLMNLGLRLFATGQRPTLDEIAASGLPGHRLTLGDGAENLTVLAVASNLVRSGTAVSKAEERDALAWFNRQLPGGDIGVGVDQLSPYANIRLFAFFMLAGFAHTAELRRVAMRLALPPLAFYLIHCDLRGRCFPPGGRVYGPPTKPKPMPLDEYQRLPEPTLTEVCQRLRGGERIDPAAPNQPWIGGYLAQVVGINQVWLAGRLFSSPTATSSPVSTSAHWLGGLSDPKATWTIRKYRRDVLVSWFSRSVGFSGSKNGAMMHSTIDQANGERVWVDGHGKTEERDGTLFIFDGDREIRRSPLPLSGDLLSELTIDAAGTTLGGLRIAPIEDIPHWSPILTGIAGESTPTKKPEEPKDPKVLPEWNVSRDLQAAQRALGNVLQSGDLDAQDERLIRQARGCIRKVQLNQKGGKS